MFSKFSENGLHHYFAAPEIWKLFARGVAYNTAAYSANFKTIIYSFNLSPGIISFEPVV